MDDELTSRLMDKFKRAMFGGLTEDQLLLGLASGSLNVAGRGGIENKVTADAKKEEKRKAEQTAQIIRTIQSIIDQLERNVAAYEQEFEHRHGDAWREKLALQILDENEIPERLEGESIEDYRERLEAYLINEMLHDDSTIKAKYKNHPEFRDYAQWAQDKHRLNMALELENPDVSQEQRDNIIDKFISESDYKLLERDAEHSSKFEQETKERLDAVDKATHQNEHTSDTVNAFLVRR